MNKEPSKKRQKKKEREASTSTMDLDFTRERSDLSTIRTEGPVYQKTGYKSSSADLVSYYKQSDQVNVVDLLKYLGYKSVPSFMKEYVKESDYNLFKKG